jgi:hypothetical protein
MFCANIFQNLKSLEYQVFLIHAPTKEKPTKLFFGELH